MFSFDDFVGIIKQGGASAIIILLAGLSLLMTRRLRFPDEVVNEKERRIEEIQYRDMIITQHENHIQRQSLQIDRLQDNFELALKSIKEDIVPLIDRALSEIQRSGSNK